MLALLLVPAAQAYYDSDEEYVRDVCLARGLPSVSEEFKACFDQELERLAERRRYDPDYQPYRKRPPEEPTPVRREPEPYESYGSRDRDAEPRAWYPPYYYFPPPIHRPPHHHPHPPEPPPEPPKPPSMGLGPPHQK